MKKLLQLSAALLLPILFLFISGCKKGQDGAPGKDGSANVTARTFTVSTWSSNSSRYFTELSFPELTSTNINSAAVEVYWGTISNNWIAVPYTYVSTPNNYFMGFLTSVNNIEIRWDCNSTVSIGSDPNTIFGDVVQIKVVVVPPAMRKPNVNHHNYEELKAAYGLKD